MSSEEALTERKLKVKVGDVVIDIVTINDIRIPLFAPATSPGSYAKRIRDIQNLPCYPNDVLLASFPKSGTNWTSAILNMLMQGKADYKNTSKGILSLEVVPHLGILENLPRPRVLHAHSPYRWLPKSFTENGGKIVHVRRNPKDTYASMFHHAKTSHRFGPSSDKITWSEYFEAYIAVDTACPYGGWFAYEREMEVAKRTNKNIYTVVFENLKKDPEGEIKQLAGFLDIKVSDNLVREISDMCSFQKLKNARENFKSSPEMQEMIAGIQENIPHFQPPQIYRKGEVGDWKNHFTVAQNELFDDIYRRKMKDIEIELCYES